MKNPSAHGPSDGERSVFEKLLPVGVACVDAHASAMWETGLLPEERQYVARAVEKRRREFTAGRNCARQALGRLGVRVGHIGVGGHREPLWPEGVIGSITHTSDFCSAALAFSGDIQGLGIDVDDNVALDPGLAALILAPHELDSLRRAVPLGCHPEILGFSIKEAFFKAVFPHCRRYLEFSDAWVELGSDDSSFTISPSCPRLASLLKPFELRGRFGFDLQRVYSAVALLTSRRG